MHIGVDVGGTNTDAVLIEGAQVIASTKQPTTADVSGGVAAAISALLVDATIPASSISAVMIGTTHFTNALVERNRLDKVGVIRLASPSGEALPPLTGWPDDLTNKIATHNYLLPGGYEYDGREIAAFDEKKVRQAAQSCKESGINSIAISSAFAPINSSMEERAARILREVHPTAKLSLSHSIGRLGMIERENGVILNAALASLAEHVIASFERALIKLRLKASLYISQNDGTLISAAQAMRSPVMTIGSGPTNSMRGAAFLTGERDAIVMDVGGTTCDIGVLSNGIPRESSVSIDIGGVRTNFRMPDILAIGLGGGTRIHIDPQNYTTEDFTETNLRIGPDSVGFNIINDSYLFGGKTLTASDIAVATGHAGFGDHTLVPKLNPILKDAIWQRFQAILEDGVDRMKTTAGETTIIAVGGGHFLIGDDLKGAAKVVRPPHASVANAVGAAIAQVGANIDQIINYDDIPREIALAKMREEANRRVKAAGGIARSIEIIDIEEIYLSYLPGRSAQIRMKAVADLAEVNNFSNANTTKTREKIRHAH